MRGNMKAERARLGLSAAEVAKAIGTTANQVYRWENGEQAPSGPRLVMLARLYGVGPGYLLEQSGQGERKAIKR